jgi:hypothetical protein
MARFLTTDSEQEYCLVRLFIRENRHRRRLLVWYAQYQGQRNRQVNKR